MALDPVTPQQIPSEFIDIMSAQLLLQPDADYLWARTAYSANLAAQMEMGALTELMAAMQRDGRAPNINGDAANLLAAMGYGEGGPLLLSMGATYPGLIRSLSDDAKKPGENILIDRPVFIDTDTQYANRVASATTKLFGTNSQGTKFEQVSIVIRELLGPLDVNGNVAPFSIPSFMLDRSKHNLALKIGLDLKRDRYRFLNAKIRGDILAAAIAAGYVTLQDVSFADTTGYTGTDNEPFTLSVIRRMGEALTNRYIPGVFGTRKYPCFIANKQWRQLQEDSEYQRMAVFQPEFNTLFAGYRMTVGDAVLCVDVLMPTISTLGPGSNITGYQAIMTGEGAYGWGVARPATLLRNKNDDGGRNNEFGWMTYEGFGVLDDKFYQVAYTD